MFSTERADGVFECLVTGHSTLELAAGGQQIARRVARLEQEFYVIRENNMRENLDDYRINLEFDVYS